MDFFSNPIEVASVFCSLVFIAGVARQKIWAWAFGIVGSFLACILFFQEKLYSESYLQGLYIVLGFYGWWKWRILQKLTVNHSVHRAVISELPLGIHVAFLIIGFALTLLTGWYFGHYTQDHYPYLDAFTTIFAIIATILEARKVLSCWYYWLVVNPVSVTLYIIKDLQLYTVLGIVFSLMSVWGLVSWRRAMRIY